MLKRKENLSDTPAQHRTLRLWPGVVIVALQWLLRFGLPVIAPGAASIGALGALGGGLAIFVWWGFFSRAPRSERWGGILVMIAALFAIRPFLHESISTAGMGVIYFAYAIPPLSLGLVIWAFVNRPLSVGLRRVTFAATMLLLCGVWTLFRTGGVTNSLDSDFAWRWSKTSEERLMAFAEDNLVPLPLSAVSSETEPEWPEFRGPDRDSVIRGVKLDTDWTTSPPVEMWRRQVGPGWSSFTVHGDLFYTQEQRGEEEVVTCYLMSTGQPIWRHSDEARFWESNGGAGPRGTPTLSDGRVYSLGGTGILNVLDALDGTVVWSCNAAEDTGAKTPMWGFSSSPLVLDDVVIVATAGSLIAYDRNTGDQRWIGPEDGGDSYSSPHLVTIDGITQILLQNETGAISVAPSDGSLLWEYPWKGYPIVQPTLTPDGDILISVGEKTGVRRISVKHESDGWAVKDLWESVRLKPYFNDSVIHDGNVYGFDGPFLASIDIGDGTQNWRGGRYGRGQIVLLADQGVLLVLSEKGELALVKANPEGFTELARIPSIEGKTWNHPVLVGNVLLVRNSQEMAAFRLTLAGG